MSRTLVVAVTSPIGESLCGLYQITDIDPQLSDAHAADVANESIMCEVGMNLLFGTYALTVFDPEARAEIATSAPVTTQDPCPCIKISDEMPEWISALIQTKAPIKRT